MIDGTAYAQSLEHMNSVVFIYGKRVESFWLHPVMRPAFNCLKETYDLACDPAHNPALHELIVTESPLTGGPISRFLHVIQSREDLLARMKMQRSLMRHKGGCFGKRCVCESLSGLAALTPILSVIAAGPPATQRLNFRLMTDFDRDRKAAERLAVSYTHLTLPTNREV